MKKDIDAAFDALAATANYVHLKRAVVQPIVINDSAGYIVRLNMEPIVCGLCDE